MILEFVKQQTISFTTETGRKKLRRLSPGDLADFGNDDAEIQYAKKLIRDQIAIEVELVVEEPLPDVFQNPEDEVAQVETATLSPEQIASNPPPVHAPAPARAERAVATPQRKANKRPADQK